MREPWSSFTPLTNGNYLLLGSDPEANKKQIAKFSKADSENYEKYENWLFKLVAGIDPLLDAAPLDLPGLKTGSLLQKVSYLRQNAIPILKASNSLGMSNIPDLYELLTAPASKILGRWFESEPLISTLATDAVIGANHSPMAPGSSYVLLHHVMGSLGGIFCLLRKTRCLGVRLRRYGGNQ